MVPTTMELLLGVVLPLAIGMLVWTLWAVLRAGHKAAIATLLVVLGMVAAFVSAYFAGGKKIEKFPPLDSMEWLVWVALVVGLLACAELCLWRIARPLIWLLGAGAAVFLIGSSWRNVFPDVHEGETFRLGMVGTVWAVMTAWLLALLIVRGAVGRLGTIAPLTTVVVMGLVSAGGAALMAMYGSGIAVMPFRMAALGLTLVGAFAVLLWTLRRGPARLDLGPMMTVWTLLSGATVWGMYLYYTKFPLLAATLLAAGPILAAIVPARVAGWKGWALRVGIVVAVLAVAIGMEIGPFLKDLKDMQEGGGY